MKKPLYAPPSFDDILCTLRAWKLWILGALLGALLGAAAYALFPPEYRARATVVVDFNIEQAWQQESDKEIFYYLEREARKLEEVAWSDSTLQRVETESGGIPVSTLRGGKLRLSQPEDGGWHFYADDANPEIAARLAASWAQAFAEEVQKGASSALLLQEIHETPTSQEEILALEKESLGISPWVEAYPSQIDSPPVVRKVSAGAYMLFGAAALWAAITIFLLFFRAPCEDENA